MMIQYYSIYVKLAVRCEGWQWQLQQELPVVFFVENRDECDIYCITNVGCVVGDASGNIWELKCVTKRINALPQQGVRDDDGICCVHCRFPAISCAPMLVVAY